MHLPQRVITQKDVLYFALDKTKHISSGNITTLKEMIIKIKSIKPTEPKADLYH